MGYINNKKNEFIENVKQKENELFVYYITSGEFDSNEIEFINKITKSGRFKLSRFFMTRAINLSTEAGGQMGASERAGGPNLNVGESILDSILSFLVSLLSYIPIGSFYVGNDRRTVTKFFKKYFGDKRKIQHECGNKNYNYNRHD